MIAVFNPARARRETHVFVAAADEEEEEHAAPGDNVEAVEHNEEPEGGESEFPEAFQTDQGSFTPGMFWWEFVAIRV